MRVLIMRHAERADEAGEPLTQGQQAYNPPLSQRGIEQARAAGAALASSSITHLATSPFTRCLQTTAGVLAGEDSECQVEVDPALCEILGPPFLPGTPWAAGGAGDDAAAAAGAWVWAAGCAKAALEGAGLPASTPVVASPWPAAPETLEAGHARYDRAIAAAAARVKADAGGGGGPTLLLVTHGEAVRRAVTRVCPTAVVYEVRHCGWVACDWEGGDDDDPGGWALVPDASVGVGWL